MSATNINVRDYGATGNGSTDDSSAVASAVAAAIALINGGCVYFPAGTYRLNSLITASPGTGKRITFLGDGDCSTLLMHGASGCLSVSLSSQMTAKFLQLRIVSNAAGPAITVTGPNEQDGHNSQMLCMDGVTLCRGSAAFTFGVRLSYAYNAVIANCMLDGSDKANGGVAIDVQALSTNLLISHCNLNFWMAGYRAAVYQEGTVITGCMMIDVTYGTYSAVASDALRNTMLLITATHIDARGPTSIAVYCCNQDGLLVSSCYLIGGWTVMQLNQTFQSSITTSQIYIAGGCGIRLGNSVPNVNDQNGNPIGCCAVVVDDNTFHGGGYADVWSVSVETHSWNCKVQNNTRATRSSTYPYRPIMAAVNVYNYNGPANTQGCLVEA